MAKGEVWVNGVLVGYILEAHYSPETIESILPVWPPERLTELEQANRWRPVAENEAKAPGAL